MLTKKTPEALRVDLHVKAQGMNIDFGITYYNRHPDEVDEFCDGEKKPSLIEQVQFIVKDIDSEYGLTEDGLREMERTWPGMLNAICEGFFKARVAEVVKN